MAERPLGVSIIAILGFIAAIIAILLGIGLLALGGVAVTMLESMIPGLGMLLGIVVGAMGIVLLVAGIFQFLISYGLWKMKKWAWIIEMIFLILGILLNLAGIISSPISSIVGIIIGGLITYYLWTKRTLFT